MDESLSQLDEIISEGAWPCVCGQRRDKHARDGACIEYDSAPCSRGSDGCEIPGGHDMCGLVLRESSARADVPRLAQALRLALEGLRCEYLGRPCNYQISPPCEYCAAKAAALSALDEA
jgi:hypothetical protein